MNGKMKAAAGAAVLAVVAAVCAYILFRPGRKTPEADILPKPTQIADFQPAEAGSLPRMEESVPAPEEPAKPARHPDIGRKVTNSFGRVYTVARVSRPGVRYENGEAIEEKPLFRHDSLNELDALFRTQPGTRIYSAFNPVEFDADFALALADGELDEEAEGRSEEEIQRVADVRRGVEMLREALAEGWKASELVRQTRRELAELADFRDGMVAAICDMKADGASAEEIETAYEAANRLFAEKDIPALLSPATARARLASLKAAREQ